MLADVCAGSDGFSKMAAHEVLGFGVLSFRLQGSWLYGSKVLG